MPLSTALTRSSERAEAKSFAALEDGMRSASKETSALEELRTALGKANPDANEIARAEMAVQQLLTGDADLLSKLKKYSADGQKLIEARAKAFSSIDALEGAAGRGERGRGGGEGRGDTPTQPKERNYISTAFKGLMATAFITSQMMQSASDCYTGCRNRTNDPLEPVGVNDSIPTRLKPPNCPDGANEAECLAYCSKTNGACTQKQREDRARYGCGMSITGGLENISPSKFADCSTTVAEKGISSVTDFWDAFGMYIMYIAIVIGVLVALYAFKIYTSAYVSKSARNVTRRAYARGNRSQGAFY